MRSLFEHQIKCRLACITRGMRGEAASASVMLFLVQELGQTGFDAGFGALFDLADALFAHAEVCA